MEAEGVPGKLTGWRYNDDTRLKCGGSGSIRSTDLMLKHIEEQTGLTCTVEMRSVRRLFVEHGNGQEGL